MLLLINLTGGNQQSARYPPSMTIEIVLWPLSRETLTQYINGFMAQQEVAVWLSNSFMASQLRSTKKGNTICMPNQWDQVLAIKPWIIMTYNEIMPNHMGSPLEPWTGLNHAELWYTTSWTMNWVKCLHGSHNSWFSCSTEALDLLQCKVYGCPIMIWCKTQPTELSRPEAVVSEFCLGVKWHFF